MTDRAMAKLFDAIKRHGGINTPHQFRQLANAIMVVARSGKSDGGEASEKAVLSNLALLSGMACAALSEAADQIEALQKGGVK